MFENGPSDKMQFVGMGSLTHPGICMSCGSATREEGYVRLGVYYDYEGEQYICYFCLIQAAEIIKCLTPDEARIINETAALVQARNVELETELERVNVRLKAYDAVFAGIAGLPDLDVIISSAKGESDSLESSTGSETGESESEEPIAESGRSNSSESKPPDESESTIPLG